ncbi:MAG: hypothetical protein AB7U29_05045 [Desulfobulbus sp.]
MTMHKQPFPPVKTEVFNDSDTVCFCFGYTKQAIEQDCLDHRGRSTILERIVREKQSGGCHCAQSNPKGR